MSKRIKLGVTTFVSVVAWGAAALAQCQLANPSFEFAGETGSVFAGWNQFGTVFSPSGLVAHGDKSAGASGPFAGDWAVSGYWQQLDAVPGISWSAQLRAGHRSAAPLTGAARAILNVEWRDANGNLISHESHTLADASTL